MKLPPRREVQVLGRHFALRRSPRQSGAATNFLKLGWFDCVAFFNEIMPPLPIRLRQALYF